MHEMPSHSGFSGPKLPGQAAPYQWKPSATPRNQQGLARSSIWADPTREGWPRARIGGSGLILSTGEEYFSQRGHISREELLQLTAVGMSSSEGFQGSTEPEAGARTLQLGAVQNSCAESAARFGAGSTGVHYLTQVAHLWEGIDGAVCNHVAYKLGSKVCLQTCVLPMVGTLCHKVAQLRAGKCQERCLAELIHIVPYAGSSIPVGMLLRPTRCLSPYF